MGYKHDDTCINKAFDEEQLFVLMARDKNAPATVLHWIALSVNDQPEQKLREAFEGAMEMKRNQEYFAREAAKKKIDAMMTKDQS